VSIHLYVDDRGLPCSGTRSRPAYREAPRSATNFYGDRRANRGSVRTYVVISTHKATIYERE